jgi:hypothetical protein
MKTVSFLFFLAEMSALIFAQSFLPSAQRSRSNQEAVWRLREAVAQKSSIEETRKAANEVLVFSKEMDVSVGLAKIGMRVSAGLLLACAISLVVYLKRTKPNQPLQRNASTGSVSSFESPARRG